MKRWTVEIPITPKSLNEAEHENDGIITSVSIGSEHVIATGIEAEDQDAARGVAVEAVNRLLDQLSFHCGVAHEVAIEGRSSKILNEETRSTSIMLRDTVTARGRVIRKARDASGNVISVHDSDKPGRLPGACTEAMSYFRRGMLAEHIHERLRNHCLAIENVVSLVCGAGGYGDSDERKRMKYALGIVYQGQHRYGNLELVWSSSDTTGVEALADHIYDLRCRLAHAKDGRPKTLPYNGDDLRAMHKAKDRVERVARDMIQYQFEAGLG